MQVKIYGGKVRGGMLECVKISLEEGVTTKTRDGLRTQREREERGGSRGRGGGGD